MIVRPTIPPIIAPTVGPIAVPGGMPWSGSGGGAAAWTPALLSGEAFFRADLGVTDASIEVTDWANQGTGGSAWDTTQGVAAQRPDLVASNANFNGKPTIHFDGADVLATASGTHWEIADGQSFVAIVVARMDSGTGYQDSFATNGSSTGGFTLEGRSVTSSRTIVDDGPTVLISNGNVTPLNTTLVQALVYTGAAAPSNDSVRTWISGVAGTASAGSQGAIVGAIAREVFIGAATVAGASGWTGDIAEVFFRKSLLTAAEDASYRTYLNSRYGLSLPGVTL